MPNPFLTTDYQRQQVQCLGLIMAVTLLIHRQAIPAALPRTHIHTIDIILQHAQPSTKMETHGPVLPRDPNRRCLCSRSFPVSDLTPGHGPAKQPQKWLTTEAKNRYWYSSIVGINKTTGWNRTSLPFPLPLALTTSRLPPSLPHNSKPKPAF